MTAPGAARLVFSNIFSLNDVSRVFQGCFKDPLKELKKVFKIISTSFKKVSRVLQGRLNGVSIEF